MNIKLLFCLFLIVLYSCKDGDYTNTRYDKIENDDSLNLKYHFIHTGEKLKSSNNSIGIWMFNKENKIADWTGKKYKFEYCNKKNGLKEPINIIWIDYTSSNINEAKENIRKHLINSSFFTETNRWRHTGNYFSLMGNNERINQYPEDSCWVDNKYPQENNHGRIFVGKLVKSNQKGNVYYSTGSYSRESKGGLELYIQGKAHDFISFDAARDKITKNDANWIYEGTIDIGNIIPFECEKKISTISHSGTNVFVLYNK